LVTRKLKLCLREGPQLAAARERQLRAGSAQLHPQLVVLRLSTARRVKTLSAAPTRSSPCSAWICSGESSVLTTAAFLIAFARTANWSVDLVSAAFCWAGEHATRRSVLELPDSQQEV